ncbi:BrnA antitoxin of type II toxin-antitoxin system [Acetitomaculum ruminis DSM 5522]|uniref:BrnA antitoxin of type II toxin-antitoxin system n=1 Tax=Acetitomaculum ruminis DSM 5522 TaxID=1120918 RepID=A0A1I0YL80_9FIRM|nr:BrnA antitoxin family protein [Acetitomaculum ruminis]SFB13566.1 BrnA antitoxin of type II toxin-antitoxin system [Acetitomaculum ruminis DSM 5522]
MRDNYDIAKLNPRPNPYVKRLKKTITINIETSVIDYFKSQAESTGIPYQTLINLYLSDCVQNHRKLNMTWS